MPIEIPGTNITVDRVQDPSERAKQAEKHRQERLVSELRRSGKLERDDTFTAEEIAREARGGEQSMEQRYGRTIARYFERLLLEAEKP